MEINLHNAGRRFNKEWIFRGLTYKLQAGNAYAVLGPNGSGKSTLLNVLLGSLSLSEGEIDYLNPGPTDIAHVYPFFSFAAPYLDLIEEFTLKETIDFHFQFKPYAPGLNAATVLELLGLEQSADKALKYFSSGMKQRTKLALACCAATPVLILDEPTSNLDTQGIDWYLSLIAKMTANKLVLVGSNQAHEYGFCEQRLEITAYK